MSLLSRLPPQLCLVIQARLASSASSQRPTVALPFPRHPNPTPHEIFHLPRGAPQSAIKSRYYELVQIYHPDRAVASDLLASTSHSRFQAISDAYAILSGKKMSRPSWGSDTPYEEELLRRKRAQWRASASSDEFGYGAYGGSASSWDQQEKEKWDQGLLVLIVVFALTATIIPLAMLSPFARSNPERRHDEARNNLANARREARELADIRRSARGKSKEGGESN